MNKKEVESKNLIISNATFKKNDKFVLESPAELSSNAILLAERAGSVHGLKY